MQYDDGANSIRAFTVRSVGPGGYHPEEGKYSYLDQTGTFRFEANVEYRFRIFKSFWGATFLDAGNVWLLRKDRKVMDDGELAGQGTHEELMETCETYQEIYYSQFPEECPVVMKTSEKTEKGAAK